MRLIDADALIEKINKIKMRNSIDIDDFTCGKVSALNCAIDIIRDSQTIGGWISVKDRLPEEDKEVLAYNGAYMIIAAYATNPTKYWYTITGSVTRTITHWMPLPEPPKEEKV